MPTEELLIRVIITIAFGAILGIESETREIAVQGKQQKEKTEPQRIGGVRTYSILALIGGIAGIFYISALYPIVYMAFGAIILLVLAAYILNVQIKRAFGLTTEVAILITFLIGFLTTSNLIDISVVLVLLVLLTFFLSQKRGFNLLIEKINHVEITDVIKFGLISVVVLPILPNQTFTVQNFVNAVSINSLNIPSQILNLSIINPFRVWSVVVVISGINLAGYIISRLMGEKSSIILTAVASGLISSTSSVIAFATDAKRDKKESDNIFAGGAIIANAVSFITMAILLAVLNPALLSKLFAPLAAMLVIGVISGIIVVTRNKGGDVKIKPANHSNFTLWPAIRFVLLIVGITLLIQIIQLSNNQIITLIVTALSGITGMDPATIAVSDLIHSQALALSLGVTILLLANVVNFIAKSIYAYIYGTRRFARTVFIGLVITVIGSLFVLFT